MCLSPPAAFMRRSRSFICLQIGNTVCVLYVGGCVGVPQAFVRILSGCVFLLDVIWFRPALETGHSMWCVGANTLWMI